MTEKQLVSRRRALAAGSARLRRVGGWVMGVLMLNSIGVAGAVEARRTEFGALTDGTKIESVELANGKGMSVRIITLGAAIQQLMVPDHEGRPADVRADAEVRRIYLGGDA